MGKDDDEATPQNDGRMVSCLRQVWPSHVHCVQDWLKERVCATLKVKPEKFADMDEVPGGAPPIAREILTEATFYRSHCSPSRTSWTRQTVTSCTST